MDNRLEKDFYQVTKATKRDITGVESQYGKRYFKQGAFRLRDAGEAAAIDQKFGLAGGTGEVVVNKIKGREPGHKYTFGNASLPKGWHEKIFGKNSDEKPDEGQDVAEVKDESRATGS